MPGYFKDSNLPKEQLTTIDLPPGTMILTLDATSMYTNIQTRPALNQIAQYFNGNNNKIPTPPSQWYAQGYSPDYEKLHFPFR